MNYKIINIFLLTILLFGCEKTQKLNTNIEEKYKNLGFALIYNDKLKKIIIINL